MSPVSVAIVGNHPSQTGAGIVVSRLKSELATDSRFDLLPMASWSTSTVRRLSAAPIAADIQLFCSSPMPVRKAGGRRYALIYDLRWLRTGTLPHRAYRLTDLLRTLREADAVLTISQAVATQLEALHPREQIHVLPLGPGQFDAKETVEPQGTRDKSILLIGGAPHKQNERAARAIVQSPDLRHNLRVVAVGVGERVQQIIDSATWDHPPRFLNRVASSELAFHLGSCRTFLHLGHSEGFGFPYLEAAAFGCVPIVRRYGVTIELFGPDYPFFISVGESLRAEGAQIAQLLELAKTSSTRRAFDLASRYRWGSLAQTIFSIDH